MSVFSRYLSQRCLMGILLVLVALVGVALTFDLMDRANNVLRRSDGDALAVVRYGLLRLPEVTSKMLVPSVLFGTLIFFGLLMRHDEVIGIWGSGVSNVGIMRALLPVGLILAVTQWGLSNTAMPLTIKELRTWGVGEFKRDGLLSQDGSDVWLLSQLDVVRLPRDAVRTGNLRDVSIFRRDDRGELLQRLDAANARRYGDGWLLSDVTIQNVAPPTVYQVPSVRWQGRIDVELLPLIFSESRDLTVQQMSKLIENQGYGQRPVYLFETWLHERLSLVVTPFLMICLVASLAQRFSRTGGFARLFLIGGAVGFAFSIFDGTAMAMGEAGLVTPLLAAWLPKLALACAIGAFTLRYEV